MKQQIPTIWVTGPWSSGSTALTGWLGYLGAYGCPPYQTTNDPRTPNSYESKALRDKLCECRNELTLETNRGYENFDFSEWFKQWKKEQQDIAIKQGKKFLVLKHPLLAFYISSLVTDIDQILLITRPLSAIENTRKRRKWHTTYGSNGAKILYTRLINTFINEALAYQAVPYPKFLSDTSYRKDLAKSLRISTDEHNWYNAENWIRNGTK